MAGYAVTADRVCKARRPHRPGGCNHYVFRGERVARVNGRWYCLSCAVVLAVQATARARGEATAATGQAGQAAP